MNKATDPFPTIHALAKEFDFSWPNFDVAVQETQKKEKILRKALVGKSTNGRLLDTDSSLVLCGSFARYEMSSESDCDWTLLIDGAVNNKHAPTAKNISKTIQP